MQTVQKTPPVIKQDYSEAQLWLICFQQQLD